MENKTSSINAEFILWSLSKFISIFYLMKKLNWVTRGTFICLKPLNLLIISREIIYKCFMLNIKTSYLYSYNIGKVYH